MSGPRLPLEVDLLPFAPSFPPGERWLVLAPHPDDEVFGMGATLAMARQRGIEIAVAFATLGDAQGVPAVREREAVDACAALGLESPLFLRFADRSLDPGAAALRDALLGLLAQARPETVFVTSPVELHPDHRALAFAVQRALRRWTAAGLRGRQPSSIAAYEVATAFAPNLLVAADQGWPAKRVASASYASQLAYRPYDEVMEAFGSLRRLTLEGVERAEAFHVMPVRRVVRLSSRGWARRMGTAWGVI
jgi:LmbE family N-acetylglucosaminyl deacetylase